MKVHFAPAIVRTIGRQRVNNCFIAFYALALEGVQIEFAIHWQASLQSKHLSETQNSKQRVKLSDVLHIKWPLFLRDLIILVYFVL